MHWPEIVAELGPGESAWHRPDVVSRAFTGRFKAFMDLVRKQHILGRVKGMTYSREYQKRCALKAFSDHTFFDFIS